MKRIVLLLFCYSLIFTGCSKDSDFMSSAHQEASFNGINKIQLTDGGRSLSSEMLVFTDYNHYIQTVKLLDSLVEEHDDAFLNNWSHLEDDDLNQKEDDIGHVFFQPLIDFENMLDFPTTLRSVYHQLEDAWLNNESLDFNSDPDIRFPYKLSEMTLHNSNGEALIGDSVYIITDQGFILVQKNDLSTLSRLRDNDTSALSEPTVRTNMSISSDECRMFARGTYAVEYMPNSRAVFQRLKFSTLPHGATSDTKIRSFRKKGNKWKRHRISLGVTNQSQMRDRVCLPADSGWSGWKRKRKKTLSIENFRWISWTGWRAENGVSVSGDFEYAGNHDFRVLTW